MSAIVLNEVDPKKRRFLIVATSVVGAGATAGGAVPFVASMFPSARAVAAGGPVEVDLAKIEPGQMLTVEYRGAPHWVIKRTPEMVAQLTQHDKLLADPKSAGSIQPEYARNDARALRPEIFVVRGVCTHLGCSPTYRKEIGAADLGAEWPGGFFCPCHQSKFDMAGRVFASMPAPSNLVIPPYKFLADSKLLIGDDSKA
jgi:ubiquinol-cytochrome c reductase iron-sulfur subunit